MATSIQTQPRVYRIGKGWKWFLIVMTPPMVALFGWLAILPFVSKRNDSIGATIFLVALGGGFAVFILFAFISALKTRLEIDDTEVRLVGLFKTVKLPLDQIRGFKIIQVQHSRILVLVPKSSENRKIKIEKQFERWTELLAWAQSTLVNLNAVQCQEELMEISRDDSIGTTPEEKAAYYKRAKSSCKVLSVASVGALLWGLLWPRPYAMAAWTLLALPWVGLLVLTQFRGLVKFDARPKSAYPTVAPAFIFPGACLAMRALLDWHVLEWNHFWSPFALLSCALFTAIVLLARDAGKPVTVVTTCLFCAVYGCGGTLALNGILATTRPTAYHAQVVGKHISAGKHTTYYLKLSPWRERTTNEDVEVSRDVYGKYGAGEPVAVWVREGRFGIPFYFVR